MPIRWFSENYGHNGRSVVQQGINTLSRQKLLAFNSLSRLSKAATFSPSWLDQMIGNLIDRSHFRSSEQHPLFANYLIHTG